MTVPTSPEVTTDPILPGLTQAEPASWLGRHWQKLIALLLWVGLFAAYRWYAVANDLGPVEAVRQLIQLMQTSAYGPLIYILLYALRPLLFFSSILLTLAGGFIFGPVWGVLYTVIAANTSAMVAFAVGHYFGQGILENKENAGTIQRYTQRMRENSFETVLIMRFIFLPYDLVNYLAGFLRVPYRAYILASILGSLPGTLTFVLAGASLNIDNIFAGRFAISAINPWTLLLSVVLFVAGLLISRFLQKREIAG